MVTPSLARASVRHLHYMFGAVTQIELKNFLDVNSIDSAGRKLEIKSSWKSAAETFAEIMRVEAGYPDTIDVRPFHSPLTEELQAANSFINTFSNYPISFEEVEIDKLVASQRTVHVEHVQRIEARYAGSGRDTARFCLANTDDDTPVLSGRTSQNAFTLSSSNPGLRFLGAYEQAFTPQLLESELPGGQPVKAILLVIGFGTATANGFRVGQRIILNNGFHRLYMLRKIGITHAPMVIQNITHPELELPPQIAELSRDYMTGHPRPALLKDFFDKRLTCQIQQRTFTRAVQVAWGTTETMVPRSD